MVFNRKAPPTREDQRQKIKIKERNTKKKGRNKE